MAKPKTKVETLEMELLRAQKAADELAKVVRALESDTSATPERLMNANKALADADNEVSRLQHELFEAEEEEKSAYAG